MGSELDKTAIDQMFNIIEGLAEYNPENPMLQSLIAAKPRLKEVEKGQIKEAYNYGQQIPPFLYAELYYEQKYGGNK